MIRSVAVPKSSRVPSISLAVAWFGVYLGGTVAYAQAFADRSTTLQYTADAGLWFGWVAVVMTLLLPGTISLTVIRMIVPASVPTAVAALVWGHADAGPGAVAVTAGCVATAVAYSAEFGRSMIQASAYGDERRFPLRPPGALVLGPLPLLWLVAMVPLAVGPLLIADHRFFAGVGLSVVGGAFTTVMFLRSHLLARRWLVFVPAGLVLHDHVPIAETAMIPAGQVVGLDLAAANLAAADTTATDLTAAAFGPAVEIRLRAPLLIAVRGVGRAAASSAASTTALLVSPSRPGTVIAEARRRGW